MQANPAVVIIGGGTGCATLYPEIARRTPKATAIVAMSDSGGSTGRIARQLRLMPMGDLRNAMLAASANDAAWAVAGHRFGGRGSLRGHHWANFLLAACFETYGVAEGVRQASAMLQAPGRVLPATVEPHQLVMRDGRRVVHGEHRIDVHRVQSQSPRMFLKPAAKLSTEAQQAITVADLVIISPGSIFTSLLAALAADGMGEALRKSRAPKVLVANLMTEPRHTDGWCVADFVQVLARHGVEMDYALYNTKEPSKTVLAKYAAEGQQPIGFAAEDFSEFPNLKVIGAPLFTSRPAKKEANDDVARSSARHDAAAVCAELWKILAERSSKD